MSSSSISSESTLSSDSSLSLSSDSSSSISSDSSFSSESSSSSYFGHLDAPTNLVITNTDPVAKEITITWKWVTLNHWMERVRPTGFIVERQINDETYVTLTYEIIPNEDLENEDYTYTDTLSDTDASRVFCFGQTLNYRVRVYWFT